MSDINKNTSIINIDYEKIILYLKENIKKYIENIDEVFTSEEKSKYIEKKHFKSVGMNKKTEKSRGVLYNFGIDSKDSIHLEDNVNKPKSIKSIFINERFLKTGKDKKIESKLFQKEVLNVLNQNKKDIEEFIEYIKWESKYFFNDTSLNIKSLNDLFLYGNRHTLNEDNKSKLNKIITKITSISVILTLFNLLEKSILEEKNMDSLFFIIFLIKSLKIEELSLQNEVIKDHIGNYDLY